MKRQWRMCVAVGMFWSLTSVAQVDTSGAASNSTAPDPAALTTILPILRLGSSSERTNYALGAVIARDILSHYEYESIDLDVVMQGIRDIRLMEKAGIDSLRETEETLEQAETILRNNRKPDKPVEERFFEAFSKIEASDFVEDYDTLIIRQAGIDDATVKSMEGCWSTNGLTEHEDSAKVRLRYQRLDISELELRRLKWRNQNSATETIEPREAGSENAERSCHPVTEIDVEFKHMIEGWKLATQHVKSKTPTVDVPAIYELLVQSELAYGASGAPPEVAPNESLRFLVQWAR